MSSYVSSISIKKILPVLLICLTVMLVGGAAPFVQDVIAQAPAAEAAPAEPAPLKADTGDSAWILASSALVMLMTLPGLALFYGGLTRSKNILSTVMHSFILLCIGSVMWAVFGYSLSFGPDQGGVIGSLAWVMLTGVGAEPHPTYGPTIPHELFMVFQMMFAAITPALITGAIAERMKFSALLIFTTIWSIVVYYPVAHWIWGGGWLGQMGALDFAGGTVVHVTCGMAALVACIVLGVRTGYPTTHMPPHNLPITLLGAGLLWFGWFGFNGGSSLGANAQGVGAFVATHIAASVATLVWMFVEWMHRGKPTALGAASGTIAGLATITPLAGYVTLFPAIIVGCVAGLFCYFAVYMKNKVGHKIVDDSLDVVGIHGVGGATGCLLGGLFASKAVGAAADGLFYGGGLTLLWAQIVMVVSVGVFTGIVTWIILKIVDGIVGLRVTKEEEQMGLDLSQHEEKAYN
jgi:Amt family ammonium transporter